MNESLILEQLARIELKIDDIRQGMRISARNAIERIYEVPQTWVCKTCGSELVCTEQS
jgi:hypothetical protein